MQNLQEKQKNILRGCSMINGYVPNDLNIKWLMASWIFATIVVVCIITLIVTII